MKMKIKKKIGICCPKDISGSNKKFLNMSFYFCLSTVCEMIVKNNCLPILIQYENQYVDDYLNLIDALVLPGDGDIHPKFYGETLKEQDKDMGLMADERMEFQKSILDKILVKKEKQIPILGICGGMQSINVIMGGTLIQDIPREINTKIEHRNGGRSIKQIAHYVDIIDKNSFLYKTIKKENFGVTSNHHQSIKKLADNFKVTALSSEDKIIEGIEYTGNNLCIGLQWHPERYATEEDNIITENFFNIIK